MTRIDTLSISIKLDENLTDTELDSLASAICARLINPYSDWNTQKSIIIGKVELTVNDEWLYTRNKRLI